MKINDLKIGSQIKLFLGVGNHGAEHRIVTVSGVKSDYDNRIKIDNSSYWHPLENFSGIELSDVIFKSLGFNQTHGSYWERDGVGLIVGYAVDGSMVAGNSFGARHCHYYYLHEVQNIWYAITGEWLSYVNSEPKLIP
jgi:hypothetical protein